MFLQLLYCRAEFLIYLTKHLLNGLKLIKPECFKPRIAVKRYSKGSAKVYNSILKIYTM